MCIMTKCGELEHGLAHVLEYMPYHLKLQSIHLFCFEYNYLKYAHAYDIVTF